jgi:hypothetical protein
MTDLHRAVELLARSSTRLHEVGLKHHEARVQRVIDRAVTEVGLAIYGRNTRSEAAARQHMRSALILTKRAHGLLEPTTHDRIELARVLVDLRTALSHTGR